MPRNGSGQYNLVYDWNDDKANGIKVLASRMQTQDQDIADALTGSLAEDGQTPLTGDLDFNSNKAVDLGDGSDAQDSVNVRQVQSGALQYFGISLTPALGTDGEDYQLSPSPAISVYPAYVRFSFVAHFTCLNDPLMQFDALAQKTMVKDNGAGSYTPLIAGDIVADAEYQAEYNEDISTTQIIISNPETVSGSVYDDLTVNNLFVNKTINGAVFSNKLPSLSNNVADANNDIDISAGAVFDRVNNVGFALAAITKRLDAAWVVGTNNGGLDTGSKANSTWYYSYAIYNPAANIADAIFSTSNAAPTLPTGYTKYAYLGAIRTDSSGNILGFTQFGNFFEYKTMIQDRALAGSPTTPTTLPLTIPNITTGIIAKLSCFVQASSIQYWLLVHTDYSSTTPSSSNNTIRTSSPGGAGQGNSNQIEVLTKSGDILINCTNAGVDLEVNTLGWIDNNLL